jgi:chemotaxis signal transduction protein
VTEAEALAAVIGTQRFRLPPGTARLEAPPRLRPLPGAEPPLIGLAAHQGALLPVAVPGAADGNGPPLAWAHLPAPASLLLGVTALVPALATDLSLPDALLIPKRAAPRPAPARPATASRPAPREGSEPATPIGAEALNLHLGAVAIALPRSALLRILDGDCPVRPIPSTPRGALGYASTSVGDALVLDPACLDAAAAASPGGLMALFDHAGRRLALPCDRVAPGNAEAVTALLAWLDSPAFRAAMALAPRAQPRPTPPAEPLKALLVAEAGGTRFALAADAVEALLAPRQPDPPPPGAAARIRGLCAHRGDVLPVLDAAEWLGRPVAPASAGARPMLRLSITPPVALLIDNLPALHRLPAASFTPVNAAGLVESVTRLDGQPLPVCRPEALAALGTTGAAA